MSQRTGWHRRIDKILRTEANVHIAKDRRERRRRDQMTHPGAVTASLTRSCRLWDVANGMEELREQLKKVVESLKVGKGGKKHG